MKIASVSENKQTEKRIAITPEIAKKYILLGLDVILSENYGEHLGIKDNEYKEVGANIQKENAARSLMILAMNNPDNQNVFKKIRGLVKLLTDGTDRKKEIAVRDLRKSI